MHDPMTVAFEIKSPFKKRIGYFQSEYRKPLITVWHIDPQRNGSDDSCDWFWRKLTKKEKDLAARLIDHEFDNLRTFFSQFVPAPPCSKHEDVYDCNETCPQGKFLEVCDRDEMKHRIECIFAAYRRHMRWRYPVRLHLWHWKFQVHFIEAFKRWAFSRCATCGGRFTWGYIPLSTNWNGKGPSWFRGERGVHHMECQNVGVASAEPPQQSDKEGM